MFYRSNDNDRLAVCCGKADLTPDTSLLTVAGWCGCPQETSASDLFARCSILLVTQYEKEQRFEEQSKSATKVSLDCLKQSLSLVLEQS